MPWTNRKTARLHIFRHSAPEAHYFITCCTDRRKTSLTYPPIANAVLRALDATAPLDALPLCAVVMPDHFHVLLQLGHRLRLGQIIAKWKIAPKAALQSSGLAWQPDFFEHRIRPEDDLESYARYLFLNPYRSGLIPLTETWPWWQCWTPQRFHFLTTLNDCQFPPAEWLRDQPPWKPFT
jgi:REP element-mobilizing transposase RayT